MSGIFAQATRVAIEEIMRKHAKTSKFGYVLSPEGFTSVREEIFELLQTSRSLKSAGDRFLGDATSQRAPRPGARSQTR